MEDGWFDEVDIDFLIAGHTKFSPDRMFGWMSSVLRLEDYFSSEDMQKLFRRRKGARYSGVVVPEMVDWVTSIHKQFKAIKGIKKFQCFTIKRTESGAAQVQAQFSHLPDEIAKVIAVARPQRVAGAPITPTLVTKKKLSSELLKDLGEAKKHIPGDVEIPYV